jgi:hypothetical protein
VNSFFNSLLDIFPQDPLTQVPSLQDWLAGHSTPHAPQLLEFVLRLTQAPLQTADGAEQEVEGASGGPQVQSFATIPLLEGKMFGGDVVEGPWQTNVGHRATTCGHVFGEVRRGSMKRQPRRVPPLTEEQQRSCSSASTVAPVSSTINAPSPTIADIRRIHDLFIFFRTITRLKALTGACCARASGTWTLSPKARINA